MANVSLSFLCLLKASLERKSYQWQTIPEPFPWKQLFKFAGIHQLLPVLIDQMYNNSLCQELIDRDGARELFEQEREKSTALVVSQMLRSDQFIELCRDLSGCGLAPVVVKGIILRSYYPDPEYRTSVDEDLFIEKEDFLRYHQVMRKMGLQLVDPGQDILSASEVSYEDPETHLYLELHKELFPESSAAFGHLNRYFESVDLSCEIRKVTSPINAERAAQIRTFAPTDHLFYMVLHAFKHFAYSGFGIRQVCDICVYSNMEGRRIKWDELRGKCKDTNLEEFATAIFRIGEQYLGFSRKKANFPDNWDISLIDEKPLLKDILEGGLYGNATTARSHSSDITLQAMEDRGGKKGIAQKTFHSLFLPLDNMKDKFPYLKRYPALLPVAWMSRIMGYLKEIRHKDPLESVKTGQQRVRLMHQYHVIGAEEEQDSKEYRSGIL